MTTTDIDYAKCLVYLNPSAEWSLNENDYASLQWLSDEPQPTEEQIIAAWPAAQAAYLSKVKAREDAKTAILDKLGLSADDIKLLLK
jgi:hypothetical protein